MRLLASRSLGWLRQHVMDLPDPLPTDHPALAALPRIARLAPTLSGLRGCMSPLEDIVRRRFHPNLVLQAARAVLEDRASGPVRETVIAGGLVAGHDPVWQLASLALADDPATPLCDRLALSPHATAGMIAEAEAVIGAPVPRDATSEDRIDGFARLLMQLYRFGAVRPRFSRARIFGDAHAKATRFADWARRHGRVTAMAQMAVCLRLIDPDHDLSDLMAEVISSQRPDCSFPARTGFSTRDQDLGTGLEPTLMTLAALHLAGYGGWRGARLVATAPRPLARCRDLLAAVTAPMAEEWAGSASRGRALALAATMTRATGENWFHRCGLHQHSPGTAELRALARAVFGDVRAAGHARSTLQLDRHWPSDWRGDAAMRWLRGVAVVLKHGDSGAIWSTSRPEDLGAVPHLFDRHCHEALACAPGPVDGPVRAVVWRHAYRAVSLCERADDLKPHEALAHLQRLCLIAQIFETDRPAAAAA